MESFEARVRDVEWTRFHHAYGPAEDVPELLLAVANADHDIEAFSNATSALWGNVFHQGTRWGVTSKTVPFFIELLANGPRLARARRFLVVYLHHLALGYPESVFPGHFPLGEVVAIGAELEALGLPRRALDGDIFGDELEPEVAAVHDRITALWERDCFLAVERGVPTIVTVLDDADDGVALEAMALLSSFPGQKQTSEPALWRVANDPASEGRRGPALVALARLGAEGVVNAARVLMDADDGLDGVYAAAAEVLASDDPSEIARRRLTELPEGSEELECPFVETVGSLVALCLEKAPPSDPRLGVTQLSALLASAKGVEKMSVLHRLLSVAFPKHFDGTLHDELQRLAVQACVDHALWQEKSVFVNQTEIFRAHGLPTERAQLAALLVKPAAS